MKKIIYLLLFLAIGKTATAQTIYAPNDVEVLPGETAFYTLTVNVGGGEYTDFEYDIVFPRAGFTTPSTENNTVNPLWTGGTLDETADERMFYLKPACSHEWREESAICQSDWG